MSSPGDRPDPSDPAGGADRSVTRTRQVAAAPEAVFDLLADPRQHVLLDGSGTLRGVLRGPDRLRIGSTFWMRMRIGLPYVIRNVVVEHEEDRLIAWRHPGRHRWRWELEPSDGGTLVSHTFDWSTAVSPRALELARLPAMNAKGMSGTLEALAHAVER